MKAVLRFVLLVTMIVSLTGCALLGTPAPSDDVLALQLLRDYETALNAYDAEAAKALLADDYVGWRNSGKESVDRRVARMKERDSTLDLDLSEAVVTVDGDTARVSEVVRSGGRRESVVTYVLSRSPEGWRIQTMERD